MNVAFLIIPSEFIQSLEFLSKNTVIHMIYALNLNYIQVLQSSLFYIFINRKTRK